MAKFNNFLTGNTYNQNFPWLNKNSYLKINSWADNLWLKDEEKKAAMQDYYRDNVNKMVNNQILDERDKEINEQSYQAATLKNKDADVQLRMTTLSQKLKRAYNLDATVDDAQLVKDFEDWLSEEDKNLLWQYLAWENKEIIYKAWLESWWEKAIDLAVWVAQSPWKRGYNLFWQIFDRWWQYISEKLNENLSEENKKAILDFSKDAVKWMWDKLGYDTSKLTDADFEEYARKKQQQLAEWTAFKGREQTDITKPLLWETRANNWWTKAWETIWDIASWIAVTAPIAAATAPIYAASTVPWALWLWALEWILDTWITKIWSTWETPTAWEMAVWWLLWAWWWLFSRYLQNLPKNKADNVRKEAEEYINKSIKPTVKGKMSQADYNKYIDDTLDVTDYMDKHRDLLKYTDDAWDTVKGKLPTNLRETSEALGNLKKTLYDKYNSIAQMAWDKWARVNMNQAFDKLDDLEWASQWIANPQIKNIIDSYKKALLEYTDDAWTISIEDAQQLTQNFNKQLTAFFKNPNMNDVSKNSVIASLNKWTKEAINDSIDDVLDDAIKNGSKASAKYTELKWLYGKIKTIEDEVSKRALVEARKNAKWLSQTVIDSLAWGEFTDAILTANLGKLWKSAIMKAIWKYYKYVNDPNVQLNNLFKLVQETNNPGSTQNIVQRWINTVIDNIPNSVKQAWDNIVKWVVRPNVITTAWEVLTND